MYSPITLVVLVVVVIIAIYGVIGIIPKYRDAVREKDAVLKKETSLQERQARLNDELNTLNTPLGVEQNIREKLNVVKDGEQVIVVVDQPEKTATTGTTTTPPHGFWWRLFHL